MELNKALVSSNKFITFHEFCEPTGHIQLLGEVEAANDFNIKLKKERKAREKEAAKELEKKVITADEEFDTELTNRSGNPLCCLSDRIFHSVPLSRYT